MWARSYNTFAADVFALGCIFCELLGWFTENEVTAGFSGSSAVTILPGGTTPQAGGCSDQELVGRSDQQDDGCSDRPAATCSAQQSDGAPLVWRRPILVAVTPHILLQRTLQLCGEPCPDLLVRLQAACPSLDSNPVAGSRVLPDVSGGCYNEVVHSMFQYEDRRISMAAVLGHVRRLQGIT